MNMQQPRSEHPKPQMVRDNWQNLNGEWDFAFDMSRSGLERNFTETGSYTHKITVPFCPESRLSGIGFTDFIPAVWYRRSFTLENTAGNRTILHFGAVDYGCTVWINGQKAGEHRGGYISFSFDITEFVVDGQNTVVVYAEDDARSGAQPSGKQCEKYASYGCMYTRTTGIWQTVWLETVPGSYIKGLKIIPDAPNGTALITCELVGGDGATLQAEAFYNGKPVAEQTVKTTGNMCSCVLKPSELYLWEPGNPCLYDLKLTLTKNGVNDVLNSYFGIRTVEWKNYKMYLNGKPLFQRLILDQGFYPDGIYTAPSDEALKHDIQLSMELGFNGARMHEKIFEERYLYHADKLGYLVWGEHANWGLDITTAEGLQNFLPEWLEEVKRDFSHPALIGWCPFNETWDTAGRKQNDEVLRNVYLVTKALDPTRPVIDTSGNYHVVTDLYDIHDYEQNTELFHKHYGNLEPGTLPFETHPQRQGYDGKVPLFMSEYGGAAWNPEDTNSESWGYGNRPETEKEVLRRYCELTTTLLRSKAFCAFCYTQLTDVEQEVNGLYTYDRKRKFSDRVYDEIRAVNLQKAAIEEASL